MERRRQTSTGIEAIYEIYFILALMIQGEERRGGQKDKNLDAA